MLLCVRNIRAIGTRENSHAHYSGGAMVARRALPSRALPPLHTCVPWCGPIAPPLRTRNSPAHYPAARCGHRALPPLRPHGAHAHYPRAVHLYPVGNPKPRGDSRSLCSYTTRPFALCAPLCLKQPRRRATAWCVTSYLAPLAVRPPCPTLVSRCGRARCPHRAAPSRCHAPRCRPHNYPRALPCGAMVAHRGSRLAPYRHHTCASRGAVPLRTAITPAKFARNARVFSPRPVGKPKIARGGSPPFRLSDLLTRTC